MMDWFLLLLVVVTSLVAGGIGFYVGRKDYSEWVFKYWRAQNHIDELYEDIRVK